MKKTDSNKLETEVCEELEQLMISLNVAIVDHD